MKFNTFLLATALVGLAAGAAQAQVSVKLGVLNDMSGLYADISGPGSVVAAKMAVEDFKAADKGIKGTCCTDQG
jgi:branched-chain amino acid transport system substrate-binding protein